MAIVAALVDTAVALTDLFNVQQIKTFSCLRRLKRIGKLSETQFGDLAICLNDRLAYETSKFEGLVTIHTGAFASIMMAVNEWSNDGIHPNNVKGRRKYGKSLMKAIHEALNAID